MQINAIIRLFSLLFSVKEKFKKNSGLMVSQDSLVLAVHTTLNRGGGENGKSKRAPVN